MIDFTYICNMIYYALSSFCLLCIFMPFYRLLTLFQTSLYENSYRNTNRVPDVLDSDQVQHIVRPDLGPKCLKVMSRRR